jgi:ribosomal-protein-alanine N-acetyltransferase
MNIRWMIRKDLKYILEIENNSFEFSWTEQDFITQLRQRNSVGMIIENDDCTILGYMIYDLHKTKLDIINFAVSQNHRRQDLGSMMIDKLKSKLFLGFRTELTVQIRESNISGLMFFHSHNFRATSIEKSPYEVCGDDAINMEYKIFTKKENRFINQDFLIQSK